MLVSDEYLTQNLVDGQVIQMLNTRTTNRIVISVDEDDESAVFIDRFTKVVPPFNLKALNGVVHAIDTLLLPDGT